MYMMPFLNEAWMPELRDKKGLTGWLAIFRSTGMMNCARCSRRQPRWLQLCSGCLLAHRAPGPRDDVTSYSDDCLRGARYFAEMQPTSCWGVGIVFSYLQCPQFSVLNCKRLSFFFPVSCWPKCWTTLSMQLTKYLFNNRSSKRCTLSVFQIFTLLV